MNKIYFNCFYILFNNTTIFTLYLKRNSNYAIIEYLQFLFNKFSSVPFKFWKISKACKVSNGEQ